MYFILRFASLLLRLINPHLFALATSTHIQSFLYFMIYCSPHEDARLTPEELERASLLQILPEMLLGAERGDSLRKADLSTHILNPRGNLRKFQDFSGQDPDILLSHLLARIRKPYKKRETPDCFWKYCV
ncbi:PREDICTED: urotensin-2 isoform X3 [Colobus angolensis palliatus]|uniref:urotensin-2 isoform X3 n=1 Tax=Colobus angolensis palliatus TaxID=336983 RepID=UPI0005F37604|nr:PREDICTED: urotensin-2 isoform X3 [Colobus angolensis palliatus]